jgi:hypothetical protein
VGAPMAPPVGGHAALVLGLHLQGGVVPIPGQPRVDVVPIRAQGELARRPDPSHFTYTVASCPEYAESKRRLQLAGSNT